MPRKIRVQFPGAIYHVMSRSDRREKIFQNDKNRELFLETFGGNRYRLDNSHKLIIRPLTLTNRSLYVFSSADMKLS